MKQKNILVSIVTGFCLAAMMLTPRPASAATCSYSFPQRVLPSTVVPVEVTGVSGHTYEAKITLAVGPSIPITATGAITSGQNTTINITAPDNTLDYQLIVTDITGGSPQEVCTPESGALLSVVSDTNGGSNEVPSFPLPSSPTSPEKGFTAENLLGKLVSEVLPIVLGIGGFLTVIFIVISGIQFVTSSGNPEAAAAARSRLIFALVGFVLIILAFAITQIIDRIFLGVTGII